jgi:FtsZ-binding cell division protein ZapB
MTSRIIKAGFVAFAERTTQQITQRFAILFAVCSVAIVLLPSTAWAELTDDVINSGLQRTRDAIASQQAIDELQEATDKIITQYQTQEKAVESLTRYNDRLRRTLDAQQVAMNSLERSIEDASLIERQIVPLMLRMISGLERFIGSDAPFKLQERQDRVERIKGYLTNANISAAERFRQVLGAYSIENGYGNSIDVYSDTLDLTGETLSVNVLQVGRSGLYYQTLDGDQSGYWDKSAGAWSELDSSFNAGITRAIRITQGKESTGLMLLPITAPEAF